LKTLKTPQQILDSSVRAGTSKETVTVQIGVGALIHCIEVAIKSMIPGEEALVFIDARAIHELRDMISDNVQLEVELKTILSSPPAEHSGLVYPLGFSATIEAANLKKNQGNQFLGQNQMEKAAEAYMQGLQLLATLENLSPPEQVTCKALLVVLHLNLSAAYNSIQATNLAIQHAQNALDLLDASSPLPDTIATRSKAFFRLGQAYEKANQFRTALWNYTRSGKLQNNAAIHACVARVKPLADKEQDAMPMPMP
jgi:tetratricopeptide (TPR) repeat protein